MKEFIIDHIDPLGQGVFKEDEKIYFIPKTLPGESGTFEVKKSSKGVHFGQLKDLSKTSPDRIQAECKFFEKCGGCFKSQPKPAAVTRKMIDSVP